ncbi:MAG: S8 family serine peptidase [Flavobacteriales bacterium]|nr:S8 family serine peptidase [Flavobacteriales bacterium]
MRERRRLKADCYRPTSAAYSSFTIKLLSMRLFSLLFVSLFLLSSHVFSQVSSKLQEALANESAQSFHRIRIEFTDNIDCHALNYEFKQQRLALEERPKAVISQLQQQASLSQQPILAKLEAEHSHGFRKLRSFWVVNMLILEAKAATIQALASINGIARIDLEDAVIIPHDPIIRGEETQSQRSLGGIEPGLAAINAPAMWALGYTGRGRMVYDYDTGVWPTHPAFADRFLAHRFPLEQCWYGYFSNTPNGNVSDHGTHTLGTMAGLIEETQDTIGVAFGSYWIANDFVTSTVEALPPLADMIGAFEWALNPDGDINTSNDIPDVINNSWRWRDDPDTVQCGGFVVNLMNAIEAAGIANVFSGGNSGPNNTTVNAPQRINTSEVNTFSVGSINGNVSFPYPISNFSTIGPTQCPSGGVSALEIHPEVVAPGQNVRSAWGQNEFNTISGTSMAAPHVSGAVLLLKEAFPYLSGEDLLWALYLTAVDLGDVGEDNVYGRGIIDVYAAFQYLSQTNTPVDPNSVAWDLAVVVLPNPAIQGFTCSNAIEPTAVITNLGTNTITAVDFAYDINGQGTQNHSWTGTLLPGNSTTVVLPTITTNQFGNLGLNVLTSISGQSDEYDLYNNRWHVAFNRRQAQALPFEDGFEAGFDLKDWFVQNPDGSTTWDTVATVGLNWSNYSASVQCYTYNPRDGQLDGLISNSLQIPNTTENVWLVFDVAYQKWSLSATSSDTLTIYVSTNCGASFDMEVYRKGGDELSTTEERTPNFEPELETDWRRDSANLSAFTGQDILIKFESKNGKGNDLYIDNVKIFVGDSEPESVIELDNEVRLYPNPTSSTLSLMWSAMVGTVHHVQVFDVLGKRIAIAMAQDANRMTLQTEALNSGLYLLQLSTEHGTVTKRFIRQ